MSSSQTTSPQQQKNTDEILSRLSKKLEALGNTIPTTEQHSESASKQFESQMGSFKAMYQRWLQESSDSLKWEDVHPLGDSGDRLVHLEKILSQPEASQMQQNNQHIAKLLDQLVVLKLNGGLGTSMGCTGPKSVIEVRDSHSFLDLAVKQVEYLNNKYGVNVPLVLMNSFNTESDTQELIKKYSDANVTIRTFQQKQYPRIRKDDLMPLPQDANPDRLDRTEWFPPGHGDVYHSFATSPLFEELRSEGKKYLFFSNVDNLGATVEPHILDYLIKNDIDFCMEVTPKTAADVKGGTLIEYRNQVKLLEIAQVPKAKVADFQDISKFTIFNTNNLWANLDAIKENLNKLDQIELIVNNKNHNGTPVIQLETAAGAAIQLFDKACGMVVPRSRFLPVKKTSDLLLVKSNIYTLGENFSLVRDSHRQQAKNPVISLDGRYYTNVADFMERFPQIPDILHLDSLLVEGDVKFQENVHLKGDVKLKNDKSQQMVVSNETIEG